MRTRRRAEGLLNSVVAAQNAAVADGNLLYAGTLEHNDGPWDLAEDARKVAGLLR